MLSKIFLSAGILISAGVSLPAHAITHSGPACILSTGNHTNVLQRPGFKQDIPFRTAHNYFVNNTVNGSHYVIIRTREDFEKYFGGAATMHALPTPINFQKEGAVAVIENPTNYHTHMRALKLTRQRRGELLLTYRNRVGGNKQSYTIRPFILLIVDKDMLADNTLHVKRVK